MNKIIILDTGPLGRIAHPRPNIEMVNWFEKVLKSDVMVIIPEIADYELRRNFILEDLKKSINRLDELKSVFKYLPINTETMLKAAELWAKVRKIGKPTADSKALDGDVILAAQAIQANAIVVTENIGHLSLMTSAIRWNDYLPGI
ncbi:MAG: PIN domain-containing protein [Chloroflexota bacterium]|nr:PIN domain-containing protein [Chloroflexota bacterium]